MHGKIKLPAAWLRLVQVAMLSCSIFTASPTWAAGLSLFVGSSLVSGLPEPIVADNRILVPAELINYMGVEVTGISGTSVSFRVGKEIAEVKAGSSEALINGKKIDMGAKAVTQNKSLFLPLRFIADVLDLRLSWDQQTGALSVSQRVSPLAQWQPVPAETRPGTSVPKPTENPPAPASKPMAQHPSPTPVSPAPIVPKPAVSTVVAAPAPKPVAAEYPAQNIRRWQTKSGATLDIGANLEAGVTQVSLLGVKPNALSVSFVPAPNRLVIDIEGILPEVDQEPWLLAHPTVARLRVAPYKGKGRVVLDLTEPTGYYVEESNDGVRISVNRVLHKVSFVPASAGGRLQLDLPADVAYQTQKLVAPDRLVIDLPNTTLSGSARQLEVPGGPVKSVRVSQFDPKTTRVVLDLQREMAMPYIVPGDTLQLAFNAEIEKVGLVDIGLARQVVLVEGTGPLRGKLSRLSNPDRIVLDIENASSMQSFDSHAADAGLVKELRAAQFMPDTYRVVAVVDAKARARLVELVPGTLGVVIETAALQGARIAVDAGHGGADPGALGTTLGLRESDVNLAIALQLEELLRQAQASVTLVRSDNSSVFLADRPGIAAKGSPDIFVSIHANSTTSQDRSASGTETLYWNTSNGSVELAKAIQSEVVAAVGTQNRGVKQQNLLVLREATVPAVLVEVAFLSNPTDEAKLGDRTFQRSVAQGILNGIMRHLQGDGGKAVEPTPLEPRELWQQIQSNNTRVYLPVTKSLAEPAAPAHAVANLQNPERSPLPQLDERTEAWQGQPR